MKKYISFAFFVVVLYLWLFYPSFWIFRERLAISNVICFVCILICVYKPKIYKDFFSIFQKEFRISLGFLILSLFLTILDFQTRILTAHVLLLVNLFSVVPVLLYFAKKHGFGTESDIVKALLIVSCIGAIFSVWCIVDPEFNEYIKFSVIKYERDSFLYYTDFRGFGFASGLTSTYGYLMGFIGALGCFYLKENLWYLFVLPFIFISILLNARTGVLIFVVGLCLSVLGRKNVIGASFIAIASILFFSYIDSFLSLFNLSDGTLKWLMDFQSQAEDVASSGSLRGSHTADALLGTMWVLPDDFFQWIIGRGYYLLRNEHGVHASDVGWINQLSYGGLLYVVPLLFFLYGIFRKVCKYKNLWFGLFFLSTIVIVNTKSSIFPSSVQFNALMMLYFIFAMNYYEKNKAITL